MDPSLSTFCLLSNRIATALIFSVGLCHGQGFCRGSWKRGIKSKAGTAARGERKFAMLMALLRHAHTSLLLLHLHQSLTVSQPGWSAVRRTGSTFLYQSFLNVLETMHKEQACTCSYESTFTPWKREGERMYFTRKIRMHDLLMTSFPTSTIDT